MKAIAFPHLKKVMNLKFVNLLINGWAWDKASISCFYNLGIWEIFQVSFNCKKIHRLHNSGCMQTCNYYYSSNHSKVESEEQIKLLLNRALPSWIGNQLIFTSTLIILGVSTFNTNMEDHGGHGV